MIATTRRPRGHSLIEIMVAVAVVGVLTSFGVPRFTRSLEQSKVDVAAANLRAIWMAERLYWLKHQAYCDGIAGLVNDPADGENFLDPSLAATSGDYPCQVTSAAANDFAATASRSGSAGWSGGLSIGADGTVTGSIISPGGIVYQPSTGFQ